jgi:hypothetical protein
LEELECTFGVVGKILMSTIQWNLFGKIWIQNVGDIDFKVISVSYNFINYVYKLYFVLRFLQFCNLFHFCVIFSTPPTRQASVIS